MAAPTLAEFLVGFPEFGDADADLVEAKIASAALRVGVTVWGDQYADGVMHLAAHMLAISPYGQQARLAAKDGSSTYLVEYERMRQAVTFGYRL